MNYTKHEYNILPLITDEDSLLKLKESIGKGYDKNQPVVLFEGKILDGYNRYIIAKELNITPITRVFEGTKQEAFDYSMTVNIARRQLTKSQLAVIAIQATDIYNDLQKKAEEDRRNKISEALKNNINDKVDPVGILPLGASKNEDGDINVAILKNEKTKHDKETTSKIGKLFGVSGSMVKQAKKIKDIKPSALKDIASGKTTIGDTLKNIKKEAREEDIQNQNDACNLLSLCYSRIK